MISIMIFTFRPADFMYMLSHKNQHEQRELQNSHLLQLLVKVARSLVEANYTCNSHRAAFQVRHTPRDPVGAHAYSCKVVHSRLGAQVVDLRRGGIQFEESVVNGAWDGLGEWIHGPLATVDGRHGGGDDGGPFLVGVAVGHCFL